MPQLLDLPPEILTNISLFLHFLDIASCKRTCHRLCDVITDSLQIAYHVELQMAGMQNNPSCYMTTPARLEMLKDREEVWRCFKPKFTKNIQLPFESSGLYDVTPGIYLAGKDEQPEERITRSIQAIRLPNEATENPTWDSIDFAPNVIDFATSIEEDDLLAAVTLTKIEGTPTSQLSVVLRRYSTHQLYDGIASPVICLADVSDDDGRPIISIEIAGENLVVIPKYATDVTNDRTRFMYVCNWKTGKKKSDPISVGNTGLVFLREDIFLNPGMRNNTIDVYHISEDGVYLAQQLSFPQLQPERVISFVACRGDPSPTANSAFPKYTPQRRPYANSPEDAIIVFAIQIRDYRADSNDEADHFFMIVHRWALLSVLPPDIFASHSHRAPAETMPWEFWGPPITRWLPAESWSMTWITLSAGQRFVFLHLVYDSEDSDEDEDEPHHDFSLLDFNTWNVKRFQESGVTSLSPTMARTVVGLKPVSAPTPYAEKGKSPAAELPENICPRKDAFANDVISRLPYVKYSPINDFDHMDHVLIDEERLIGLKGPDFDTPDSLDVVYFG